MTPQDHFDLLQARAGPDSVYPVVHSRWGYATFGAYVVRICNDTGPDEFWVGEFNQNEEVVEVKRICQY